MTHPVRPNRGDLELRTYSHLAEQRRIPDEYDLGTTGLLFYPRYGLGPRVPVTAWYERYQQGSPLVCDRWDAFTDARRTTYARYVSLSHERETQAEGLFQAIEATRYDERLDAGWVKVVDRVLGPLRYPVHGLQMVAAYVGSMAPEGRIAVAYLFQSADEMRRVQQLSRRMIQLRDTHPDFGHRAKRDWQEAAEWQPLRELVERLLVTYDFGEAIVALGLCAKPALDALFGPVLGAEASRRGDPMLAALLNGFARDAAWHEDVTRRVVGIALAARKENRAVVDGWIDAWAPRVAAAVAPFAFATSEETALAGRLEAAARDFVQKGWES